MKISMALFTIRKSLKTGEVLSEKIEILPDDPGPELKFLGLLYAEKLKKDPRYVDLLRN